MFEAKRLFRTIFFEGVWVGQVLDVTPWTDIGFCPDCKGKEVGTCLKLGRGSCEGGVQCVSWGIDVVI